MLSCSVNVCHDSLQRWPSLHGRRGERRAYIPGGFRNCCQPSEGGAFWKDIDNLISQRMPCLYWKTFLPLQPLSLPLKQQHWWLQWWLTGFWMRWHDVKTPGTRVLPVCHQAWRVSVGVDGWNILENVPAHYPYSIDMPALVFSLFPRGQGIFSQVSASPTFLCAHHPQTQ